MRRLHIRRCSPLLGFLVVLAGPAAAPASAKFQEVRRTQFIAAAVDPVTGAEMKSSKGCDTDLWGIWPVDPGPRGVFLKDYRTTLEANDFVAPDGWVFNRSDFWLEEYGRLMPSPDFPLPNGRYMVTAGREVKTVLTVGGEGPGSWRLDEGTLYDVTHLPCRAARYRPKTSDASPANANLAEFPVTPGGPMPDIEGCHRQDYAVVFVTAIDDQPPAMTQTSDGGCKAMTATDGPDSGSGSAETSSPDVAPASRAIGLGPAFFTLLLLIGVGSLSV